MNSNPEILGEHFPHFTVTCFCCSSEQVFSNVCVILDNVLKEAVIFLVRCKGTTFGTLMDS